jgi:dihydrofolate reductase
MRNGTTFHFVDATPHDALAMAVQAADGRDVVLGGGPATIQQFLAAGIVDEMHLVIAPVLLGVGERLFEQFPAALSSFTCSTLSCEAGVAHVHLTCNEPSN